MSFSAPFFGATGNLALNQTILGMSATADDLGDRFVASDGGCSDIGTAIRSTSRSWRWRWSSNRRRWREGRFDNPTMAVLSTPTVWPGEAVGRVRAE